MLLRISIFENKTTSPRLTEKDLNRVAVMLIGILIPLLLVSKTSLVLTNTAKASYLRPAGSLVQKHDPSGPQ